MLKSPPKLQAQVPALSSKRCGINVSPKVSAVVAPARATPICTAIEAKLKTRKSMAKRYKVTGTGKVMRRHAGKQHSNEKKAHKRLKRLSKEESVFVGDVRSHHLALRCEALKLCSIAIVRHAASLKSQEVVFCMKCSLLPARRFRYCARGSCAPSRL